MGARTERIESDPHFAGLQVSGTPVTLVEGGQVATLVLTATVPVLCSPQVLESCVFGNLFDDSFSRTGRWGRAASTSILPLAWQGRNSAAPGVDFCTGSESVRFLSKLAWPTFQNPSWFYRNMIFNDCQVGLPSCAHKICRHDWNSSHVIPLR